MPQPGHERAAPAVNYESGPVPPGLSAEQPHHRAQPHLASMVRGNAELQDLPDVRGRNLAFEVAEGAEAPEPAAELRT